MKKENSENIKIRVKKYRDRMKEKGFKLLRIWVPEKIIDNAKNEIKKIIDNKTN